MKLNVYEYIIKDNGKKYTGSYTVKAGCRNERKLQIMFNSKLVDSFDHHYMDLRSLFYEKTILLSSQRRC